MKLRYILALFGALLPASAQYTGPAILSRGEAPAALSLPQIRFSPSATGGVTYDSGISSIGVNDQGQLATGSSWGQTLSWTVSGAHGWKHARLGMAYSGAVTRYNRRNAPSSVNQSFMLGLTHQFSRRMSLDLRQTAGVTTRNYVIGGLAQTVPFDPGTTYTPTTDFFDNRNVYLTSSASLTYQWTKRMSFNFGGLFFTNNRQSKALSSAWGTNAQGDVQYRLSGRSTVGGTYMFQHFQFGQVSGGTDAHTLAGSYSVRLTKSVEFSGQGGVVRTESKFIQKSLVDPVIAALLGISQTTQIVHRIQYQPMFAARVSRAMNHGVAYVSAGRTVTPGNGLFLTSMTTSLMGGYNYTGFRRWSMNAQVGYVYANATGPITGQYGNLTEILMASRRLGRYLAMSMSVASRDYKSADYRNYNRRITTAMFSLSFSPGDVRLPTF